MAVGVKAANIREMRDMGLTDLPEDLLVPLVAQGATPTYIKDDWTPVKIGE